MVLTAVLALVGLPLVSSYVELDFTALDKDQHQYAVLNIDFLVGKEHYHTGVHSTSFTDLHDLADFMFEDLDDAGVVEYRVKGRKIRLYGIRDKNGTLHPITYFTMTTRKLEFEYIPKVTNPAARPVEFDLARLPLAPGRKTQLALDVASRKNDFAERVIVEYERFAKRADAVDKVAEQFKKAGLKLETEGSVIRILGWERKAKLIPAARGGASSRDLKAGELPTVIAWPLEPCVVLDFSVVRGDPIRGGKFNLQIITDKGETFREDISTGGQFKIKDLASLLAKKCFKVEVDGEFIRVYGWIDPKSGRLRAPIAGSVTSRELKESELPRIKIPFKPY